MPRDNWQIALDNVNLALENAADAYADAAGIMRESDPALTDLFDALARRRDAMAAELATQLRKLGDLPAEPDSDRKADEQVMRHIKATVATDERTTLRDEALAREDEIRAAIAFALAADPPDQITDLLGGYAAEVAAARERLERAVPLN